MGFAARVNSTINRNEVDPGGETRNWCSCLLRSGLFGHWGCVRVDLQSRYRAQHSGATEACCPVPWYSCVCLSYPIRDNSTEEVAPHYGSSGLNSPGSRYVLTCRLCGLVGVRGYIALGQIHSSGADSLATRYWVPWVSACYGRCSDLRSMAKEPKRVVNGVE